MKSLLLALLTLLTSIAYTQENFSGSYGYIVQPETAPAAKDKSAIPGGRLVLLKMEGNKYRFWLDVLTGAPGYNRGETDGTIVFLNDTASFDNTFEDASHPCILKFKKTGMTVNINSQSTSFNCGFGNGVSADGDYAWIPKQEALDNDWLKKQYPQSSLLKIGVAQAEIYHDQDGMQSFGKKQFLSKGASFLNIAETEKTVYTEWIAADGTLQYGWIRKSDIKM